MTQDKWLKIITPDETINVTDEVDNFIFLDAKPEFPKTTDEAVQVKGVDGELAGVTTFAPFPILIRCGFDGYDFDDVNLLEQKLRRLFFKRVPYYIICSDFPGMKFAVKNPDINPTYLNYSAALFEMTFSVYKGYSESLKDTSEFSLSDETWQFEAGVLSEEIKYKNNKKVFDIYNGSSDTINPLLRHKLNINIRITAPYGFKLKNIDTGDVFEYKKPLKHKTTINIIGVHPYINGKRVGINTNYEYLTLRPGHNRMVIDGRDVTISPKTEFIFNYIYR